MGALVIATVPVVVHALFLVSTQPVALTDSTLTAVDPIPEVRELGLIRRPVSVGIHQVCGLEY